MKDNTKLNRKGAITISGLLIVFIVFLVVITSALLITTDTIGAGSPYDNITNLDTSFYGGIESVRLDDNGSTPTILRDTIYATSDNLFETNESSSSSSNSVVNDVELFSWKSLSQAKGTFNFIKSVSTDVKEKLHVPAFFFNALILAIVVIVSLAVLSALRGVRP